MIRGTNKPRVAVIIVAAGMSRRMQAKTDNSTKLDKIFADINGKTVLSYSLDVFQKAESVDNIIVVTNPKNTNKVKSICEEGGISKLSGIVKGGDTRMLSVMAGVDAVKSHSDLSDGDIILIHDGARPFVDISLINRVIEEARIYKCVIPVVAVKDTVKVVVNGFVENTPKRETLFLAQTPQAFELSLYSKALKTLESDDAENITDDSMLIEKMGIKTKIVEGDYNNIKITTPEDLERQVLI